MENKNLKRDLEQLDAILKDQGISRRDAMKMMGVSSMAALMMGGTEAEAATSLQASSANGHVLIVGGGLSGMSTAARLSNTLSNLKLQLLNLIHYRLNINLVKL